MTGKEKIIYKAPLGITPKGAYAYSVPTHLGIFYTHVVIKPQYRISVL